MRIHLNEEDADQFDTNYREWDSGWEAFKGTLIVPDNRTFMATNPQPSGLRITGGVSCTGENISTVARSDGDVNVTAFVYDNGTLATKTFVLYFTGPLEVQYTRKSAVEISESGIVVMSSQLIWIARNATLIPNATRHGRFYMAICNHTISMVDIPSTGGGDAQPINSSTAVFQGEAVKPLGDATDDENQLVLMAVDSFIYNHWWYFFQISDTMSIACSKDVLTPYSASGAPCQVNNETWTNTVRAVLDMLVAASPKVVRSSQTLLYLGYLGLAAYRTRGQSTLKKMSFCGWEGRTLGYSPSFKAFIH